MEKQIQQINDNEKGIFFQLMLPLDVGIKIDADASVRILLDNEKDELQQLTICIFNLEA